MFWNPSSAKYGEYSAGGGKISSIFFNTSGVSFSRNFKEAKLSEICITIAIVKAAALLHWTLNTYVQVLVNLSSTGMLFSNWKLLNEQWLRSLNGSQNLHFWGGKLCCVVLIIEVGIQVKHRSKRQFAILLSAAWQEIRGDAVLGGVLQNGTVMTDLLTQNCCMNKGHSIESWWIVHLGLFCGP